MNNKSPLTLKVLGCGDAFGNEGRFNTSFLVSSEEESVLLDCGASTLIRLKQEKVSLENTYTGKTAAALLQDVHSGKLDNQTVLYWNTLNSREFSDQIKDIDYHQLPDEFHAYFTS